MSNYNNPRFRGGPPFNPNLQPPPLPLYDHPPPLYGLHPQRPFVPPNRGGFGPPMRNDMNMPNILNATLPLPIPNLSNIMNNLNNLNHLNNLNNMNNMGNFNNNLNMGNPPMNNNMNRNNMPMNHNMSMNNNNNNMGNNINNNINNNNLNMNNNVNMNNMNMNNSMNNNNNTNNHVNNPPNMGVNVNRPRETRVASQQHQLDLPSPPNLGGGLFPDSTDASAPVHNRKSILEQLKQQEQQLHSITSQPPAPIDNTLSALDPRKQVEDMRIRQAKKAAVQLANTRLGHYHAPAEPMHNNFVVPVLPTSVLPSEVKSES